MPIQAPQWTEFLSCPVCYNVFDEMSHCPISLGCGHTVCKTCLSKLHQKCPFDQSVISRAIDELPVNFALLQLVGSAIPETENVSITSLSENCKYYKSAKRCIEQLAVYLKPFSAGAGNTNAILSRPMQRKLVTLVNCQLIEEEGRARAMRGARSLGERTVTELILQHQNPQQLSANLWAAVRARGCQFLGPAMQEEVLKLILLALEDGSALSRKVLVLFVVQRLESQYPQASKTAIGHVVQLLYRASCFKVTKRDEESSLMQLKEEFRTYETLRREHDAQIVQIATEAGLRISPDQWSSLLYGDTAHKSHMQSIIDKLQTPQSFAQSVNELVIALQRTGDPGNLSRLRPHFELLANIDPSPDAPPPSWENLEAVMKALRTVVEGLVDFIQHYSHKKHEPTNLHNTKYKTSMCRDLTQKGNCPRGANCTFAHSQEEMERYRARNKKFGGKAGTSVSCAALTPKEKAELAQVTRTTHERMIAKSAFQDSTKSCLDAKERLASVGPASIANTRNFDGRRPIGHLSSGIPMRSTAGTKTILSSNAMPTPVYQKGMPYHPTMQDDYITSLTHPHTIPGMPRMLPYEMSHYSPEAGIYYPPSPLPPYCQVYQRGMLPGQYPGYNYRTDPGAAHMQYASGLGMFDPHTMPVHHVPESWKQNNQYYISGEESSIPNHYLDHSNWNTSQTTTSGLPAKNLDDLCDRRKEILARLNKTKDTDSKARKHSLPVSGPHSYSTMQTVGGPLGSSAPTAAAALEPKPSASLAKSATNSFVSARTTASLARSTSCSSSTISTTTISSYIPWSSGDTPNIPVSSSNQMGVQTQAGERGRGEPSKDREAMFNLFHNLEDDITNKDPYQHKEVFIRQHHAACEQTDEEMFIPFDPPIISKYGPISRSAKTKFTDPVQITAKESSCQVTPITAVTPYERPYPVTSLAMSWYRAVSMSAPLSTQSQLRPDAKPFVSVSSSSSGTGESNRKDNSQKSSTEPYMLWNVKEGKSGHVQNILEKEVARLVHHSKRADTEQERLQFELWAIELQISLKQQTGKKASLLGAPNKENLSDPDDKDFEAEAELERFLQENDCDWLTSEVTPEEEKQLKDLHRALEAQRKETENLTQRKQQEQQDRWYAEKLVIEELEAQKNICDGPTCQESIESFENEIHEQDNMASGGIEK